ncbi:(deoxy)nucleoside triphosphate pyrophosphohydrolase [Bacillus sp. 165]|uniref:(deoxy)nucleoside triphosphate pyrophosphohydrolase n=1 Tax=Bacillus sp. 165 TaxID=1529117 RepID=UPI001ADCA029|nr:(deoxy)nucleoside triphosphate pyrophosphohydrolase [Bacillus sp. 165]MBO9128397.1 (deoxy)nucleoside triphosphate pyrophosphohydrolase [Bacillus sp. 165]
MKKRVKVVGAVAFNERGEILCALRSSTMSHPNLWEFPGGKIEEGELPQESLVREIKEELDCTVNVYELIEDTIYEYENVIVNLLTYKTKITEGKPKAREHAELKWVPLQDLHSLEWAPADISTVDILLADTLIETE